MNYHPSAGAPRVSVVIPVYNAERFLAVALDSVFAQTFKDFVVLAVDDGSTDRSQEILKAYVDPRLRLIEQPNSGGPARPRNVGIAFLRSFALRPQSRTLLRSLKSVVSVRDGK